jgi:hypothetical protein
MTPIITDLLSMLKEIGKGILWIFRRNNAKGNINTFIQKSIGDLQREIEALVLITATLAEDRISDTSHRSYLSKLIREFQELPLKMLSPIFAQKNVYDRIREQYSNLSPIADNMKQSFELFEPELQKALREKTEQTNNILGMIERMNGKRRREELSGEDLDFAIKYDQIIGQWQSTSPKIEQKIMSGATVNPFVLKKQVYDPLAEVCREYGASLYSSELLSIIRSFWVTFDALKNARSLHRNEILDSIRRLRETVIQLQYLQENV